MNDEGRGTDLLEAARKHVLYAYRIRVSIDFMTVPPYQSEHESFMICRSDRAIIGPAVLKRKVPKRRAKPCSLAWHVL
jgi:hypothetical protein